MSVSGLRVLRGPDWRGGDTDGGEGHVGTVIELLGNHTVRVLWDMGQESTCSAGHDGKHELQIFDTAQIGVCHPGRTCAACGDTDLYGMLWRCQLCAGCDLCPLCYHDDKHDLRHQFLRIDVPGSEGIPVPKRKASVKNRALGIFAGSKVTRGKDWQWGDQDGAEGSEGEVKGYENVSPDSSRNLVKVDWPNGVANTYRLGFYGYVDVTCVEEEAGPCYYRDHLPVLDTTTPLFSACPWSESAAEASSDLSQGDNCSNAPSEADDSISHIPSPQLLGTDNNSTGEASEKTSDSRRWRKENSGIVVDQETDDGTISTGSVAKVELSELCGLTSSSTLQKREDEEKTADEHCQETDNGTISTGSVVRGELSELCGLTSSSTLQKREDEEKTADEHCQETDNGTISTGSGAKVELSELCGLTSSSTLQNREDEEKTANKHCQETDNGTISIGSVARGELSELCGLTSSSNPQEKEDEEKTADECCPKTLGSADEVAKREEGETPEDTEAETFAAGDKVIIKVSENKLMELQEKFHIEGMPKVMGQTGEVVSVAVSGTVTVRFTSSVYTFHPHALTKVPTLTAGSTVRIREKEEEVKVLNARVGWREELRATIGKVGRVLNIDSDGDVLVSFGRHHFLFAPACCIPAPHTKPDSLSIESGGKLPDIIRQAVLSHDKKSSASGENTEVSKKKTEEMYRVLREKIQSERMTTRGRGDIQALYNAIKNGDHVTVRAMCLADKTLVEREYQDLTALVGACIEGDSHIPVVRALMEAGANPNHGLPPFKTPLSAALEGRTAFSISLFWDNRKFPMTVSTKAGNRKNINLEPTQRCKEAVRNCCERQEGQRTMSVSGLRVLRGPDWRGGDTDGGEGHVGTVVELLGNHTVRVLWDMGQESTCSAGHDGKCELKIFDTAQIGVCHAATKCVECGDTDLYGMLWRCQLCAGCDLCPLCYHDDKHDIRHQFLRIDVPGTEGIPVPKRKTSVKNRALGIFPGSKVTRGKDWQWGDQDGGQGSEGEVKGYENVSPDSSRNLVKVDWPNGVGNSYRLGFYGYVDVTCVEEEAGPCYYRDHLPVLDTTTPLFSACPESKSAAEASSGLSQGDNCGHEPSEADDSISHTSSTQASYTRDKSVEKVTERAAISTHWRKEDSGIVVDRDTDLGVASTDSAGKRRLSQQCVLSPSTLEEKEDEEKAVGDRDMHAENDHVTSSRETGETAHTLETQTFVAGDKVAIKVTENMLIEFQENFGSHTEGMTKAIGQTGEVVNVAVSGAVSVRFTSITYTINPQALTKVPTLKAGSTVRIREKEEEVKVLNARVGWRDDMHGTLGKVGRVLKIDSDGDVLVSFGRHHFLFAPACCVPAPRTKPDSLSIESGGKLPQIPVAVTSSAERKTPASEEVTKTVKAGKNTDLYHSLRYAMKADSRHNITQTRGGLLSLLSTIQKFDHVTVRQKIMADRSLLEAECHPDLTPLILACVEGSKSRRVVDTLLELGANVNHGMPPSKTPLYACLQGESEELVVVLLEAGADAFAVDEQCRTYIHFSAAFGLPRAIRAFAAYGVDINIKDDSGNTALHIAVDKFKDDAVTALVQLDNIDLRVTNKRGFSALHHACIRGNSYALQCMLERDTSEVNQLHQGQSTPLHTAASNDHDECIRLLVLLGGAQVNMKDNVGASYTPLHHACIKARFKGAEALMEMGADLNAQDSKGDTPLLLTLGGQHERDIASEAGIQECQLRVAIACMLIRNGAYVDIENKKGRNPLSYGATSVKEEVRRFIKQNETLVKRKRGGMIGTEGNIQSLAISQPFSASLLAGKGDGKLKEALKGVGLPCGLCGASKSDVTLQPCQHKCVCSTCSVKVIMCPLCDEQVKEKVITNSDD
ncbi:uncharacterized protein [Littorina saxatilis]|uniref:uncharacterized protein n=1 Tax=Littorina saxatilis TaxID=31220 RepID=UPI0038B63132